MIDFKDLLNRQGLSYAQRLGNYIQLYAHIYIFCAAVSEDIFLHTV